MNDTRDLVALDYRAADAFAEAIATEVTEMRSVLDRLNNEWQVMRANVSGQMIEAFTWQSSDWLGRMKAQIDLLETAEKRLARYKEQLQQAQHRAATTLGCRISGEASRGTSYDPR